MLLSSFGSFDEVSRYARTGPTTSMQVMRPTTPMLERHLDGFRFRARGMSG